MKKSELRKIIREEIRKNLNESVSGDHIASIQNMIYELAKIKIELIDDEYVGWGVEDIKKLVDQTSMNLAKIKRLIKANSSL